MQFKVSCFILYIGAIHSEQFCKINILHRNVTRNVVLILNYKMYIINNIVNFVNLNEFYSL